MHPLWVSHTLWSVSFQISDVDFWILEWERVREYVRKEAVTVIVADAAADAVAAVGKIKAKPQSNSK